MRSRRKRAGLSSKPEKLNPDGSAGDVRKKHKAQWVHCA